MNIILIGMMGSGKSVVGKILAEKLGFLFLDTDTLIEEKYGKISDIFSSEGEIFFRNIETETVKGIKENKAVISTGGGIVLKKENLYNLKINAVTVYLKAEPETLFCRTIGSDRPLLQNGGLKKITDILEFRAPLYEKNADFIITTDNKTISEITDEIKEHLSF